MLTLNVNGLNSSFKRHRVASQMKKQDLSIRCFQESRLTHNDTHKLEVKGWRKFCHTNGKQTKKARVTILISDTINFKPTTVKKDKERHYIMIKFHLVRRLNYPKYVYGDNIGAPRIMKQALLDPWKDLDRYTIIVGDFSTPLAALDRSLRQKTDKKISGLKLDIRPLGPNRHLHLLNT